LTDLQLADIPQWIMFIRLEHTFLGEEFHHPIVQYLSPSSSSYFKASISFSGVVITFGREHFQHFS